METEAAWLAHHLTQDQTEAYAQPQLCSDMRSKWTCQKKPILENLAESKVHHKKPSDTMKFTRGRVSIAFSKSGCMSLVERANGAKRDMEGSLSVLSTPAGIWGTFCGKGRSMIKAVVSERELAMKLWFPEVVNTVTMKFGRRRSRRARWRSGIVWPFDMKGNKTTWYLESLELASMSLLLTHNIHKANKSKR